jgi:hypothetical protein
MPDESGGLDALDPEELSGSLLIEDAPDGQGPPAVTRLDPRQAPPAEPVEPAHRALLGMPKLPQATPAPMFGLSDQESSVSSLAKALAEPAPHAAASDAPVHTDAGVFNGEDVPGAQGPEAAAFRAAPESGGDGDPYSSPLQLPKGGVSVAIERARALLVRTRAVLLASAEEHADGDPGARPRWMLPAVTLAGLVVGVTVVGVILSVAGSRKSPSASEQATAESAATTSPTAPANAASAAAAAPQPAAAPPTPVVACTVAAAPQAVAPTAMIAAGVEVRPFGDGVALGFATTEHEARALRIDPTSLAASGDVTSHTSDPIRRVRPVVAARDALGLAVDTERKHDRVQGRRTLPVDPPLQVGASGSDLVWARPGAGPAGKLWPLVGPDDVEALRGASEGAPGDTTTAIVFRRAGAVWVGVATGYRALAPKGDLARIEALGPTVGSPTVAVNDGQVVMAWADRPSADVPWRLRMVHMKAGEAPGEPATFSPPPGGPGGHVMSPSLAAVPGGRFLLVWTEGPMSQQRVRAVTLSPSAEPVGRALEVSKDSVNSGQGQAAVTAGAGSKGIIGFLAANTDGFEVAATSIVCGD